MTPSRDTTDAIVDSLTRLGLSTYEARVFVGLVQIGVGTASDIAAVVDVPRSQVYGAADALRDRGLLSIQQARPKLYQAVSLEEAEAQLAGRLETERRDAFDRLATMETEPKVEQESNNVWTIEGMPAIQERAAQLVADASTRVIIGGETTIAPESSLYTAITTALDAGTTVYLLDPLWSVIDQSVKEHDAVVGVSLPANRYSDVNAGLLVIGDDDTILVSIIPDKPSTGEYERVETAIWSEQSTFARVLYQLIMGSLSDHINLS